MHFLDIFLSEEKKVQIYCILTLVQEKEMRKHVYMIEAILKTCKYRTHRANE